MAGRSFYGLGVSSSCFPSTASILYLPPTGVFGNTTPFSLETAPLWDDDPVYHSAQPGNSGNESEEYPTSFRFSGNDIHSGRLISNKQTKFPRPAAEEWLFKQTQDPTHPCLAYEKWSTIDTETYKVLKHALTLATRFLRYWTNKIPPNHGDMDKIDVSYRFADLKARITGSGPTHSMPDATLEVRHKGNPWRLLEEIANPQPLPDDQYRITLHMDYHTTIRAILLALDRDANISVSSTFVVQFQYLVATRIACQLARITDHQYRITGETLCKLGGRDYPSVQIMFGDLLFGGAISPVSWRCDAFHGLAYCPMQDKSHKFYSDTSYIVPMDNIVWVAWDLDRTTDLQERIFKVIYNPNPLPGLSS